MHANFDSPMELLDKRQTAEVCGPLQWDGEPADTQVTIEVSITQGNSPPVEGASTATFSPANDEWEFYLTADKKLKAGQASAHGEARPVGGGNPLATWDQVITFTYRELSEEALLEVVREELDRQRQNV